MDMDNARWAMDVLRAATEQNEGNTPNTAINPYKLPVPSNYVSQFRIDGQPILPPLMTAEKRRQMQQLRQQALELEAKLKQPHAIRSTSTVDESQSLDAKSKEEKSENNRSSSSNSNSRSRSSSNSSSSGGNSSNSSSSSNSSNTINTTQRLPQLQKTETYIYDSTQHQDLDQQLEMIDYHQEEEEEQLSSSLQRNRPQTLDIEPTKNALLSGTIPTICVNPPTPLQPIDTTQPGGAYAPSPTVSTALGPPQRKLNNITNRILKFESTGSEKPTEALLPLKPTNMHFQNETPIVGDKRMMRSSTSPALSAAQMNEKQFNRSRSFTLEQPSQALVEHMEREAKKPPSSSPSPPPVPPPVPPLPAEVSPRCRFAVQGVSSSPSALGLAHLRRDTVESRAKQVQRNIIKSPSSLSASASTTTTTTTSVTEVRRRGGSSTAARLQYQQRQLEELLHRALHDTNDVLAGQEQLERNKLSLAKRQMFKDIKLAHRDRFQQLMQYQHEEQRRMQEEFDRQQKFLIDQICTEINVSAYAHEPLNSAASPSGISEYTSTDDLPTPTSPSNTFTLDSLDMTPRSLDLTGQENSMHTARKRLFDVDNDTDSQMSALNSSPTTMPQQSASTSSRTSSMRNSNKIKRPVQRAQSKSTPPTTKKIISPVQSVSKSKSPTPARRVTNNNNRTTSNSMTTKTTSPQQMLQMSKTRRSASPSRLTQSEMQRRHEAATLLNAATRGFLVRRLFRTEQVQRIVQTIRDTLIFVLNLHMETYGSSLEQEEPSNIRLKARLLQQLCSASRTLHLIFFQTSIKERMEIIARDRKRIKTKLMAMHIKNRQ